jgi:hypothetical protein
MGTTVRRARRAGAPTRATWALRAKESSVPQAVKTSELSAEEIVRLGEAIYDRELKHRLEPAHRGEFVAIHVVNGDYFVDPDEDAAMDAALAKYPGEVFYMTRVGSRAAHRIGSPRLL